jgi:transposase
LASQIIEGGVDASLFENFLYETLKAVRKDPATKTKKVILFMDNATIHSHSEVLETARKFKVNVLFNAQYSPWLNPVEQLFGLIKKKVAAETIESK